jgi:diaminopimelate epimerase
VKRTRFWKLTAAGNDFVLVVAKAGRSLPGLARRLCRRRTGVGADGLLVLRREPAGIRVRYFNADGSRAFCGNGCRGAAWWAFNQGWSGRRMRLFTSAGELEAKVAGRERVAVSMPDPGGLRLGLDFRVQGRAFVAHAIDTGVPHAVVAVKGLAGFPVALFGPAIRRHRLFSPEGTNVDFVARAEDALTLRTYERGVEDETWACGTGAVAAAVVGWRLGWVRPPVRVRVRSGDHLKVSFAADAGRARGVWLEGPARVVFQGEVVL